MKRTTLSILLVVSCLTVGAFADTPARREVEGGWFAARKAPVPRPTEPAKVFVIPVRSPIEPTLLKVLKYKITRARSEGADMIVFDMDTPGGRGDVMEEIQQIIQDDLKNVYTVCWVHPQAHSAGALIALSCNEIVISSDGIIGDSMPIIITEGGLQALPAAERSKIEAPIRAKIRKLATANGYNAALCDAMINTDVVLWVIRNKTTEELRIVNHHDWQSKVDHVPGATRNPEAKWDYVRLFDASNQLVDLPAKDALYAGLTAAQCDTLEEIMTLYHIVETPETLKDRPLDEVAMFLNSPAIAGVLMTVMILAFFGEMRTPGVGVYGAIATLCLCLIIASKAIVGLANTVEVSIFAVGVLLLIVELFLIPGFGVAGIAGLILMFIGAAAMLLPNAPGELPLPTGPSDWNAIAEGIYTMLIALAIGVGGGLLITAGAPKLPIARRVVLDIPEPPSGEAQSEHAAIHRLQVGQTGIALSALRPSGRAKFDNDIVDVIADGMSVTAQTPVHILRIDGNRIVVEPAQKEA